MTSGRKNSMVLSSYPRLLDLQDLLNELERGLKLKNKVEKIEWKQIIFYDPRFYDSPEK